MSNPTDELEEFDELEELMEAMDQSVDGQVPLKRRWIPRLKTAGIWVGLIVFAILVFQC